jgi:hypothetical protein
MPDFREPIIDRLRRDYPPRQIFLAGASDPVLGCLLADAAEAGGGTLHIAATALPDWTGALRHRLGDRCVLHQAAPAQAASVLPVPQLAWIDNDPNWHAVSAVLNALLAQAERQGRDFPVTFIANAGWPYARRDSYNDPAAIPEAFRHPHERAGVSPGERALTGLAGLFTGRYNATTENEPRNGVLTAVEDFVSGRAETLRFALIPGFFGLAVLGPRHGPGAQATAPAALQADLSAMAAALEAERVALTLRLAAAGTATAEADSGAQLSRALYRHARRQAVLRAKRLARRLAGREQPIAEKAAPLVHRLRASPILDPDWYRARYPDVARSGDDPAEHYVHNGWREGRDPGPLFSTQFYLQNNPDVGETGVNPVLHYLDNGAREGRNPSPLFYSKGYENAYPDVSTSGQNPLEHYLAHGRAEGRTAARVPGE